jgi:hypothetical protein
MRTRPHTPYTPKTLDRYSVTTHPYNTQAISTLLILVIAHGQSWGRVLSVTKLSL